MHRFSLGWSVAALAVALGGQAGARAEELGLEQALELGRVHSRVVAAARARTEAAGEMRWEALGHLMPRVELQAVAIRSNQPGELFGLGMNRRDDMVSLMGRAFGMAADDQGRLSTTGMDNDVLVDPEPFNAYLTRVTAELPLFAGGMIVNRLRQSGLAAAATALDGERRADQVDFDVARAWTELAKAREFQDLLVRARETTLAHVQLARDHHETGFLVSSEVLRAEVFLAEMDELVMRARNGARLAQAALNFHLGLDQNREHVLGALPELPAAAGEPGAWAELAMAGRKDLAAAGKQLKAGELERWVAAAAFAPTVGLQAAYDWTDDSFLGTDEGGYSIKAALTLNVFRGGGDRARLARARHQARAWREEVARFHEGVQLEVRQAWGDYESALLRSQAARQALAAARENLRVVEDRFREGVARMIDLLDAETALREAEVRELAARYDGHLARFQLRHAAGLSILDKQDGRS